MVSESGQRRNRNIIVIFIIFVIIVKVFKNMDKDGSGTVSKDEFLKICKNLSKEQVSYSFYLRTSQNILINN